ncbi:MAG: tRNA (N6-threonylcarbamoyladenosine(37)-N6)-methyltransferase TrmO [Deltaproteobacteria bacterium]|nr:tRNA (N6-threonylcarbamoyladenosine(37)-N6)-methyltransferase TrmO [Deltaproteobacteria bacterium]
MTETYLLKPIGWVRKQDGRQGIIEVEAAYLPALLGLAQYSHVWVIFWFHENDNPRDRGILQVHPCRNPANPLTGVFATRAPVRPNLIGLSAARLLGMEGHRVILAGLDAREGTPVLDMKPYLAESDAIHEATGPSLLPHVEDGVKPRDG